MSSERTGPLFDAGLQPERTGLAWRRTAISLAAGSLVAMRILPGGSGDLLLLLPGVVGFAVAVGLLVMTERRYLHVRRTLASDHTPLLGGGVSLLCTALACVLFAVAALGFVLAG
jgi:uncharacterized membrane protein YidH (DUF202 family)